MTLKEIRQKFIYDLNSLYTSNEIETFFYWSIEDVLQLKRVDFSLNPNQNLSETSKDVLDSIIKRLTNQEPIQYILGYTEFYGLQFKVNPKVLIPRPETEDLVDWVIRDYKSNKTLNVLDLGTGSGCIPISIKKNLPQHQVYGVDISEEALQVARHNARINTVEVSFMQHDVLALRSFPVETDIIISNPPYVKYAEQSEISKNVLEYEPHLALFVANNNPLVFYQKICELAKNNSRPTSVYFELNEYHTKDYLAMLETIGCSFYEFRKDYRAKTRMLKVVFE